MLRSGYESMFYGAMCKLDVMSQLLLVLLSSLEKMIKNVLSDYNS